jgi:hypothetical protein
LIDNLSAYKAAGVREAIEARGTMVQFLPQYSPGLKPYRNVVQQASSSPLCAKQPNEQFLACAAALAGPPAP